MNINQVVEFLRAELKDVKFDEILNHLPLIKNADVKHIEGRQISEDVIDLDIDTGDVKLHDTMNWTITLRRVVMWYPIPKGYIDINRETLMADNVEVFPYGLSLVQSDVIQNSDGEYALNIPVCMNDLDYKGVNDAFADKYVPAELCESVIDAITDGETKLRVLKNIKEFYDCDYNE